MNANSIVNKIREFYVTASPEAITEVDAAFKTNIPKDISIEEYLYGFQDEYFHNN